MQRPGCAARSRPDRFSTVQRSLCASVPREHAETSRQCAPTVGWRPQLVGTATAGRRVSLGARPEVPSRPGLHAEPGAGRTFSASFSRVHRAQWARGRSRTPAAWCRAVRRIESRLLGRGDELSPPRIDAADRERACRAFEGPGAERVGSAFAQRYRLGQRVAPVSGPANRHVFVRPAGRRRRDEAPVPNRSSGAARARLNAHLRCAAVVARQAEASPALRRSITGDGF